MLVRVLQFSFPNEASLGAIILVLQDVKNIQNFAKFLVLERNDVRNRSCLKIQLLS